MMTPEEHDTIIAELIHKVIVACASLREDHPEIPDNEQRELVVRALVASTASFTAMSFIPKESLMDLMGDAYESALKTRRSKAH